MTIPQSSSVWQPSAELALPKRSPWQAMLRGFFCRCPACGEGRLFNGYLKPVLACGHCGEDLSHQRADDAPPYFTMLIVGHIIVPIMVAVALSTELSNLTHILIWVPLTAAMALALLRPVKGTIIGLQWALRMHGFDGSADPDGVADAFARPAQGPGGAGR